MMNMKNYRGVTFVETIVVIGIMSAVMLGSSLFFVRMWRTNQFTYEIAIASLVSSRGIQKAEKDIRAARPAENGAFPIVSAEDHSIVFYMDYDEDGIAERVHYFVEDQKFKVGVTEPNLSVTPPTYADADESVKDAANYIVNETTGYKTFEYYNDESAMYSYSDVENAAMSTPLSEDELGGIKMVKILLFVNPDPLRAPNNVRIQSFVVVRNLADFNKIPT
ncbi:MAG: prepilin-type N-terminal cleavage/methylation domain-containing protein [Parcubacteria group bacterium]|jgi:hypothetical protein